MIPIRFYRWTEAWTEPAGKQGYLAAIHGRRIGPHGSTLNRGSSSIPVSFPRLEGTSCSGVRAIRNAYRERARARARERERKRERKGERKRERERERDVGGGQKPRGKKSKNSPRSFRVSSDPIRSDRERESMRSTRSSPRFRAYRSLLVTADGSTCVTA